MSGTQVSSCKTSRTVPVAIKFRGWGSLALHFWVTSLSFLCFCFEKLFFLKFSFFFSTKCYDEQAFKYYAMVRFPIIGLKSDSELTIRGKSDNLSNSRRIRVKEKMIRNTTFNKIIFQGFKVVNIWTWKVISLLFRFLLCLSLND